MRKAAFLLMDKLRGAPIQTAVQLIEASWKRANESGSLYHHQQNHLNQLLAHASRTTEYYKHYKPDTPLQSLPVVNKSIIRSQRMAFRSSAFASQSLKCVSTSGSTGEPFQCYHDPNKVTRKLADLLYYNQRAGYEIGMKHLLIRATPKRRIKQWLQNEIWIDPTQWSDNQKEQVRRHLLQHDIRIVIGYPSIVAEVAKCCQQHQDHPNRFALQSFISTSEPITPEQQELISATLGCQVFSRYATEEFGVIGQSDDCQTFNLNAVSHIIEILKVDTNDIAQPGEPGRVVVTDLFSYAMPLIRYEVGDLAIHQASPELQAMGITRLSTLEGKQTHAIWATNGQHVSPLAILVAFKKIDSIHQFQFCQMTAKQYEIRISPLSAYLPSFILDKLYMILGSDAQLQVKAMETIPALSSGKRPAIVCEWHKESQ